MISPKKDWKRCPRRLRNRALFTASVRTGTLAKAAKLVEEFAQRDSKPLKR